MGLTTYLVEEILSVEGVHNFVQVLVVQLEVFNDIILNTFHEVSMITRVENLKGL